VSHDDRARHNVGPPLVQPHETRESPLVPLTGQTYEFSFLIRNTYGWGQPLRGLMDRPHGSPGAASSEKKEKGQREYEH
jgi:hypothetical protein